MKTNTLTVKIPLELNLKLDKLSKKINKTKSVILRLAIEELLRKPDLNEKLSAYELLSDYCGIIDSLPEDLSSSKSHFKGYGE